MEKDIGVGVLLILIGLLLIVWTYKNPVIDKRTDMLNTDFKGYLVGILSVIFGAIMIYQCVSSGHSLMDN